MLGAGTATAGTSRQFHSMATYNIQNAIVMGGLNINNTPYINQYEWYDNNANWTAYGYIMQGTGRQNGTAAEYGYDKALWIGGQNSTSSYLTIINRISNLGYVDTDVTTAMSGRYSLTGFSYGIDVCMALGGIGSTGSPSTIATTFTNTGTLASDATMAGYTARANSTGTHL